MAKYLVVANVTGESPALRKEVAGVVAAEPDTEFVIVVPAGPIPPFAALVGGHEWPMALARRRAQRARARLEAVGARVTSVRVGGCDPLEEIETTLEGDRFEGVIISTLPHRVSHWLRADLPAQVARRHPDLQVRHVIAPGVLYRDDVSPSRRAAAH